MSKKKTSDVKDPQTYETLIKQGMDKEKAAKMAGGKNIEPENNPDETTNEKTGNRVDEKDLSTFEDWTKEQLKAKAKEKGVSNYENMDRLELINALRNFKLKR